MTTPTTSQRMDDAAKLAAFAVGLQDDVTQASKRATVDAIARALPSTWQRRADTLDAARPREGDYLGRATPDEVAARDARLADMAALCRVHAAFLALAPVGWLAELAELVDDVLDHTEEVTAA